MKIEKIKIRHIKIPLRVRFSQANNSTAHSDSIILELESSKGIKGFGESCPRTYVTGESNISVMEDIAGIMPLLKAQNFSSLVQIRNFVECKLTSNIGLASVCAIELALLDVWSKENQSNLVSALGGKFTRAFQYSGVIPMQEINKLSATLLQLKKIQFKDFKLKIGKDLSDSLEKIQLIRNVFGKDISIRLDVNTCWNLEDALEQIPVFLKVGVDTFEQPFSKNKLRDFKKITALFGKQAKIMVDESLTSFASAKYLIENKICNHFNLKISKHGGIFNTLKIYDFIIKNGLSCQLGAHFGETSILSAAGVLLSSIAPQIAEKEGAFGLLLLENDISNQVIQINEKGVVINKDEKLEKYGLGIDINKKLLFKYTQTILSEPLFYQESVRKGQAGNPSSLYKLAW